MQKYYNEVYSSFVLLFRYAVQALADFRYGVEPFAFLRYEVLFFYFLGIGSGAP